MIHPAEISELFHGLDEGIPPIPKDRFSIVVLSGPIAWDTDKEYHHADAAHRNRVKRMKYRADPTRDKARAAASHARLSADPEYRKRKAEAVKAWRLANPDKYKAQILAKKLKRQSSQ